MVGSNHRKCVKQAAAGLGCPHDHDEGDHGLHCLLQQHDVHEDGLGVSSQPGEAAVLCLVGGPAVQDGLHDVAVQLVPQLGQS